MQRRINAYYKIVLIIHREITLKSMVSGCLKNRIFIAVGFNQRNKKLKSLGFSLIMQANLG